MKSKPFFALVLLIPVALTLWGLTARSTDRRAAVTPLLQQPLVVDGHNDLPWRLREEGDLALTRFDLKQDQSGRFMTDIPRLRQGKVAAQFWSAYVPAELMNDGTAVKVTREQIDLIHRLAAKYPDDLEMAYTAADVARIRAAGRIASLIGVEGGHSIDNSLAVLRDLYARGARYMTLTHFKTLDWADSANDQARHHGLTEFGKDVVREMNRLGMLVDISHVSAETMRAALSVTRAPVIASHSSADSVTHNVRNVPDDVLRAVAANGGVVMVNFYPPYILPDAKRHSPSVWKLGFHLDQAGPIDAEFLSDIEQWTREDRTPVADVHMIADHIDHIVRTAGVDYVGIGSDFDGVPTVPKDVKDVSRYPVVVAELLARGYADDDIRKIMGENILRALAAAEDVARRLQR